MKGGKKEGDSKVWAAKGRFKLPRNQKLAQDGFVLLQGAERQLPQTLVEQGAGVHAHIGDQHGNPVQQVILKKS